MSVRARLTTAAAGALFEILTDEDLCALINGPAAFAPNGPYGEAIFDPKDKWYIAMQKLVADAAFMKKDYPYISYFPKRGGDSIQALIFKDTREQSGPHQINGDLRLFFVRKKQEQIDPSHAAAGGRFGLPGGFRRPHEGEDNRKALFNRVKEQTGYELPDHYLPKNGDALLTYNKPPYDMANEKECDGTVHGHIVHMDDSLHFTGNNDVSALEAACTADGHEYRWLTLDESREAMEADELSIPDNEFILVSHGFMKVL